MIVNLVFLLLVFGLQAQYNHQTSGYVNTTWMSLLDNGIPLRKLTIIGSHSSMGTGAWGDAFQTQSNSLMAQMQMGMRALDIRCRHYNNQFPIHDRLVYLNTDFGAVLSTVSTFLQTYPMETVLIHVVEEYSPSGNTRTFEDTFISYKNTYSTIIWNPTTQNPVLGEVRGKIVIIQDFSGLSIHGLMYSTFTVLPHKWFSTNWDQYDKWMAVKSFLASSNTVGDSMLSFWTGHGGSFPYFVASGKSSPGNTAPRLATGLTTPGFSSSYPDFPRVGCFIGICTIAFEGINILGYNYINNNNLKYLGIVFTDFLGDILLQKAVGLNVGKFTPCPGSLLTQGCTFCTSTGQCLGCNTTNHYAYNASTSTCLADKGFYLNWINATANIASNCSTPLIGCL
jgi:1-phosphatidylinositol phosphodiesterase